MAVVPMRRQADGALAPARYGREGRCVLHRLADEAQVVHRPLLQGGRLCGLGLTCAHWDDCHSMHDTPAARPLSSTLSCKASDDYQSVAAWLIYLAARCLVA